MPIFVISLFSNLSMGARFLGIWAVIGFLGLTVDFIGHVAVTGMRFRSWSMFG